MENSRWAWRRWVIGGLGSAVSLLLVTGCAQVTPTTGATAAQTVDPVSDAETAADVYAACATPGVVDYNPVSSLAALAQASAVVVRGHIQRIEVGRTATLEGQIDHGVEVSSVIVVSDVTVVAGELEPDADRNVYIEYKFVDPVAGDGVGNCAEVLPEKTEIVAYLNPAWDGSAPPDEEEVDDRADYWMRIADPSAGRPAGQALYSAAALEGLTWQLPGSGQVIWPLSLGFGPGDIRDTLPDGALMGPRA